MYTFYPYLIFIQQLLLHITRLWKTIQHPTSVTVLFPSLSHDFLLTNRTVNHSVMCTLFYTHKKHLQWPKKVTLYNNHCIQNKKNILPHNLNNMQPVLCHDSSFSSPPWISISPNTTLTPQPPPPSPPPINNNNNNNNNTHLSYTWFLTKTKTHIWRTNA